MHLTVAPDPVDDSPSVGERIQERCFGEREIAFN